MTSHMEKHIDDVKKVVSVFKGKGKELPDVEAYCAWSEYSDSYAAGWLSLPVEDQEYGYSSDDADETIFQIVVKTSSYKSWIKKDHLLKEISKENFEETLRHYGISKKVTEDIWNNLR